jgi:hypothetical protein
LITVNVETRVTPRHISVGENDARLFVAANDQSAFDGKSQRKPTRFAEHKKWHGAETAKASGLCRERLQVSSAA